MSDLQLLHSPKLCAQVASSKCSGGEGRRRPGAGWVKMDCTETAPPPLQRIGHSCNACNESSLPGSPPPHHEDSDKAWSGERKGRTIKVSGRLARAGRRLLPCAPRNGWL